MSPERRTTLFTIILLFLLTFISYGKSLQHYFLLDDTTAVFAGYLLSNDPTKILSYNFDVIYMSPLWRFVVALSYIPNYLISGDDAWSYHLVSILIHFGNGVLVYVLINKLSANRRMSALVAVLFTISLNKADAVMMVAHRTTLLGAFFALLALYMYACILIDCFSWKRFAGLAVAFAAALGSYETALVLPGVFVATGVIYKGQEFFTKSIIAVNVAALSIVVFLVLFLGIGSGNVITETDAAGKAAHIFGNVAAVVPSFIIPPSWIPVDNTTYYNMISKLGWLEGVGVALILLVFLAYLKTRDRMLLFGLFVFLVIAIPTATTRWMYYPDPSSAYHRMRFSIGKYSYLSSLGYFTIIGCFASLTYARLAKSYKPERVFFAGSFVVGAFILFNLFFIDKREKDWAAVTKPAREQMEQLKKMKLNVPEGTNVYIHGFCNYDRHARAHMRVLYGNPDLNVREAADYAKPTDRDLFIVASKIGIIATQDINLASRVVRSR